VPTLNSAIQPSGAILKSIAGIVNTIIQNKYIFVKKKIKIFLIISKKA